MAQFGKLGQADWKGDEKEFSNEEIIREMKKEKEEEFTTE